MHARLAFATAAFCFTLCAGSGFAQTPGATTRVRGSVEKMSSDALTVKTASGDEISLKLAGNWQIVGVTQGSLADIKPGVFIGVGARPQPDGTLNAVQVSIFPESARGQGEGHRDWSSLPEATMTNATVADEVTSVDGATLKLTYKGGEQRVAIKPETVILKPAPAEKSDLKPGSTVTLTATKEPDGSMTTARVTIAKGVALPL
jgi:hypothetical protein